MRVLAKDLRSPAGIADAAQFRAALDKACIRAIVLNVEKDQSDMVSKAADPGKFKDERKWPGRMGTGFRQLLVDDPRCDRNPLVLCRSGT